MQQRSSVVDGLKKFGPTERCFIVASFCLSLEFCSRRHLPSLLKLCSILNGGRL